MNHHYPPIPDWILACMLGHPFHLHTLILSLSFSLSFTHIHKHGPSNKARSCRSSHLCVHAVISTPNFFQFLLLSRKVGYVSCEGFYSCRTFGLTPPVCVSKVKVYPIWITLITFKKIKTTSHVFFAILDIKGLLQFEILEHLNLFHE